MNYLKFLILFIISFISYNSFAVCSVIDNELITSPIRSLNGLKIEFYNDNNCPTDARSGPYDVFLTRGSDIKNANDIKFHFSQSDIIRNNNKEIINFYSFNSHLARIYIANNQIQSSIGSVFEDSDNSDNYIISGINMSLVTKIAFGSNNIIGTIDNIRYNINDVDMPLIIDKSYKILEINTPSYLQDRIAIDGVIYYDYTKDGTSDDNTIPLQCLNDDDTSYNLGYYFDDNKNVRFRGCCFQNLYSAGEIYDDVRIVNNLNYDESYVGDSNSGAHLATPPSGSLDCAIGVASSNIFQYYFDSNICEIEFVESCDGNGIMPEDALINACSTISQGDIINAQNGRDRNIQIACKVGCENQGGGLFYNLSSNDAAVTISGAACTPKTQTLTAWVNSPNNRNGDRQVPVGINANHNAVYLFDIERTNIPCLPGYAEGSISYYFENNSENIKFNGSCTPLRYQLSSWSGWGSFGGAIDMEVEYNPTYTQTSSTKGVVGCQDGFTPSDNLGYYFTADNPPLLQITGSCESNYCMESAIEALKPNNVVDITMRDNDYSVGERFNFVCDNNNGYEDGANGAPHIICQPNGNWSNVSGNCILHQCLASDLTAMIGNIYNSQNFVNSNYGNSVALTCNNANRYFNANNAPNAICNIDGWQINNPCIRSCVNYNIVGETANINSIRPNNPGRSNVGHIIEYTQCNDGYVKNSTIANPRITCQENGNWQFSGSDNCIINDNHCGNPDRIANANHNINSGRLNQEFTINCNTGYVGVINLRCQSDGNWNIEGSCQLQCHINQSSGDIGRSTTDRSTYPVYNDPGSQVVLDRCNNNYIKANNNHPYKTCNPDGRGYSNSGSDNCIARTGDATHTIDNINSFDSNNLYELFRANNTVQMSVSDGNWVNRVVLPGGMADGQRFILTRNATWLTRVIYGNSSYTPPRGTTTTFIFDSAQNLWVRQ